MKRSELTSSLAIAMLCGLAVGHLRHSLAADAEAAGVAWVERKRNPGLAVH